MNPDEIADRLEMMKRNNTVDHHAIEELVKARLKKYTDERESNEDKVLRLIKGDFEGITGMSFDEFMVIYKYILENNPEKLI